VKPGGNLARTELRRTAGLDRGTSQLARRAELTSDLSRSPWSPALPVLPESAARLRESAQASAPRQETGFSRRVKLQVRTRAGRGDAAEALCEACGLWLGRRHGECQHLVARGMGGTSNPLLSTAANAALLCRGCHQTAESRDREMGARGFWLPQGTDPRMVPMMLASEHGSGVLVWRAEDGLGPDGTGYLLQAPEVAA
jgi:hypothetical protein